MIEDEDSYKEEYSEHDIVDEEMSEEEEEEGRLLNNCNLSFMYFMLHNSTFLMKFYRSKKNLASSTQFKLWAKC